MENASVVETAAGTGVLSEYLSSVLPNSDSLTVTDLSQAMLKVAEHNLAENEDIKFEVASGTELTFDNDSFASVLCQFGIMFFFGSVSWILGGIQSPQTGRGVNI
jgi:ubiquinone/menaquinone biosynthesis C-methylase UbiE